MKLISTQILFKVAMVVFLMTAHHCDQNCYALEEVEEKRSWHLVKSIKKCLNYFMCTYPIMEDEKEQFSYYSDFLNQNEIEALPTEILHKIYYELSPLEILHLSKASKNINGRIDDRFWKDYLKTHKWEIWDESLSFKKIAFAHHWFKQGKIDKAAQLSHPIAIKIKRERDEIKEEQYEQYKRKMYTTSEHFTSMLFNRCVHRIQDYPVWYKMYY